MKVLLVANAVLLAGICGDAMAGCDADGFGQLLNTTTQINNNLSNKRIDATSPGGENWKEDHCPGGNLYKVGDGTPVDPRVLTGSWTLVDTTPGGSPNTGWAVRYNYGTGGVYTWKLYRRSSGNPRGLCWEDAAGTTIAIDPTQIIDMPASATCP